MEESAGLITGKKRGCCSPGSTPFRFLMLLIISLVCFGSYFSYDEIQPLKSNWIDPTSPDYLGITSEDFGILYSVYSIPNTVLVFFGGMVGDRLGLRISSLIFVSFVCAGTILVALGPVVFTMRKAWIMMVVGRICLGVGGESLNVIQTAMTTEWFEDTTYLATAFGLVLAVSRFGDFLAVSGGSLIAKWFGSYKWTLWAGALLTALSFVATIVYGIVDKLSEKAVPKKPKSPEKINFFAVFKFDGRFWLISLITMLYYGGVTPFLANASDFLTTKWGYSDSAAGLVSSLIILASMVLSPVLGKVVDTVGYRPYFVVFGGLAILPAHLVLGLTWFTPIVSIIIIGLSFSLVPAALWPSIPRIVDEENIATAYGMMTAIQNAGLALINYLIGVFLGRWNYDPIAGYNWLLVGLAGMDVLAIATAQILLYMDHSKGKQLCAKQGSGESTEDSSAYPSINYSAGDSLYPDQQ